MKLDNYSLDTHPLVWYFLNQKTLSFKAREIIDKIFRDEASGIVSTMVILEAYYVGLKNPNFDFKKFLEVIKNSKIKIISFDIKVLNKTLLLPRVIDIHDRVIVTTAIVTNSQLITKDRVLRENFPLETVW